MEPVAVRSVGQTPKQRLLEYAAQRLGRDGLAARLKVSEATLDAWIDGRAEMPAPKQLALADLIGDLGDEKQK
jgi:DNA-binding transcriptional regulator YdaS (Cro superfamily)